MAPSILELAKQGDAAAIASLINRSIQPKGITATARLVGDCLHIDLRSAQTPNQKAVVALIRKGMLTLQVKSVRKLLIAAYKTGNSQTLWEATLNLAASPISPEPIPVQAPEITLVHQPVPIKHLPQTYQDIIIRFSDRLGKIKCLCTLTELIEALNSFSWVLTASPPDLQNLREAIAASTVIDENGDRVITNISVLQPGSPWQKAKIRLTIKIFFEPEQDESSSVITLDVEPTPPPILLDDLSSLLGELGEPRDRLNETDETKPEFDPKSDSQDHKSEIITLDSLSNFGDPDMSVSDSKGTEPSNLTLDELSSFW